MNNENNSPFIAFLCKYDQDAWWSAVQNLPVHDVDRDATRIWFYFWPLWLRDMLAAAESDAQLLHQVDMNGNPRLEDQVDSSHTFVYGHRYWPQVKRVIIDRASLETAPESLDLNDQIRGVARDLADQLKADESLLYGITAIGFMTLQQVGLEAFNAAPGDVHISHWARKKSPRSVLRDRAKNDGGGLLGFLKGLKQTYTIRFHEGFKGATFKLIENQELTQASMTDQADYPYADSRCVQGDGPIPTECRSAACGTCWFGVLGGNEHLSQVNPLEGRRVKRFGYIDTDEARPLIRLACKAKATGNVTVAVPPWNAVAGRWLDGRQSAIGGSSSSPGEETVFKPRRH